MTYQTTDTNIANKLLRSRILQVLLVLIIIALSFQVFEQYKSAKDTSELRAQSEAGFYEREADRRQLEEQVQSLHDPYHIEAEIRRHFDVAKEGEEVVIILDPPPEIEEVSPAQPSDTSNKPWFIFW